MSDLDNAVVPRKQGQIVTLLKPGRIEHILWNGHGKRIAPRRKFCGCFDHVLPRTW